MCPDQSGEIVEDWMLENFVPGLVSIIIPTFNRRHLLNEALRSVFEQDYRPIEVIVIDDGSSDGTDVLVEAWQQKHQEDVSFEIFYAQQSNQGAAVARNRGLRLSRGQYIQFLDSDDLLLPNKLSAALAAFETSPQVDIVYAERGDFLQNPQNFRPWERRHADLVLDPSPAAVVLANVWTPLPVFSRRVLRQAGPWDESLRSLQDWEYIGRVAFFIDHAQSIGKVQALCREHEGPRLSVNPWGDAKGVEANATASAALYPLVAACESPQRAEALVALARRILSCVRVSTAAGHLWLAREIVANHNALMLAHRKTRWEARFWRSLLFLPDRLLEVLFRPVRAVKLRRALQQVMRQYPGETKH